ncbi:MAG: hypothetical protein WBF67_12265, partial [Olleya sp.]
IGLLTYLFIRSKVNLSSLKLKTKEVFSFGGQRVIGELALFSLDFLPVYLISIYVGLTQSGYLSMSLLILKLAAMLFELIGSIVLPYYGKMYSSNTKEYFLNQVDKLLFYGLIAACLVSIIFYYLSTFVIVNFFTSQTVAIEPTKFLFFVFPFYVVYILLRNIIDVVSTFSYNSVNLSIVVIIQVGILLIGFRYNSFNIYHTLVLVIPYTLMGLLTYITWSKLKMKLKK